MEFKLKGDKVWGIIFVIFGGFVLSEAIKMPYRAGADPAIRGGFFPIILSVLMMFLSLLIILKRSDEAKKEKKAITTQSIIRVLTFIVAIAAYVFLLEVIGFIISAFLLAIVCARILGEKNWLKTVIISGLIVAAIYVAFAILLRVRLPIGFFGI